MHNEKAQVFTECFACVVFVTPSKTHQVAPHSIIHPQVFLLLFGMTKLIDR